jgi:dipeptidase E
VAAVKAAKALFIGGGNTFRLLKKLHEQNLVDLIRERVTSGNMLYIGSSCGSTVAGATIHTSICMPIMEIPSFKGLGLFPFNISPHYADPEPKAKLHELGFTVSMEENREQRVRQYTDELDDALPTVGLREGTCLELDQGHVTLHGERPCRVFVPKQEPKDYPPGSNLDFLLH